MRRMHILPFHVMHVLRLSAIGDLPVLCLFHRSFEAGNKSHKGRHLKLSENKSSLSSCVAVDFADVA